MDIQTLSISWLLWMMRSHSWVLTQLFYLLFPLSLNVELVLLHHKVIHFFPHLMVHSGITPGSDEVVVMVSDSGDGGHDEDVTARHWIKSTGLMENPHTRIGTAGFQSDLHHVFSWVTLGHSPKFKFCLYKILIISSASIVVLFLSCDKGY